MQDDQQATKWARGSFVFLVAVACAVLLIWPGAAAVATAHFRGRIGGGMVGTSVDLTGWPAVSQGLRLLFFGAAIPYALYYVSFKFDSDNETG